jgi:CHAD domain-containing protein
MMRLTSSIRDRDITLEFLTGWQPATSHHSMHRPRLAKERSAYQRQFAEMVRRWSARDFSAKWRNGLSLRSV